MERRQKITPASSRTRHAPRSDPRPFDPRTRSACLTPARAEGPSHAKTYVGYRRIRGPALLTRAGPLRIRAVRCRVHECVRNCSGYGNRPPGPGITLTLAWQGHTHAHMDSNDRADTDTDTSDVSTFSRRHFTPAPAVVLGAPLAEPRARGHPLPKSSRAEFLPNWTVPTHQAHFVREDHRMHPVRSTISVLDSPVAMASNTSRSRDVNGSSGIRSHVLATHRRRERRRKLTAHRAGPSPCGDGPAPSPIEVPAGWSERSNGHRRSMPPTSAKPAHAVIEAARALQLQHDTRRPSAQVFGSFWPGQRKSLDALRDVPRCRCRMPVALPITQPGALDSGRRYRHPRSVWQQNDPG